jgi:hypothetical protein
VRTGTVITSCAVLVGLTSVGLVWQTVQPQVPEATPQLVTARVRDDPGHGLGELPQPSAEPAPLPVSPPMSPSHLTEVVEHDAHAERSLEALVRSLEQIEGRAPADFHSRAARELEPYLLERSDRLADRVLELSGLVDGESRPSRVRGALLALSSAWGDLQFSIPAAGDSECWRSAVLGAVSRTSLAGEGDGVLLKTAEYQEKVLRPQSGFLPLELRRIPGEALQAELMESASRLADDLDALLCRDVAVLALGPGVDERHEVLEFLGRLLFDTSPWGMQVRETVIFVLCNARGDGARGVLLEFLQDDQLGEHGKTLARWWMSGTALLPGELEQLAEPLSNPEASTSDRVLASGSLLKRLEVATPDELERIEALLVDCLEHETDSTVHLSEVVTLAHTDGGRAKLTALNHVLLEDKAHDSCRLWAAKGLGMVSGALHSDARSALQAALSGEPAVYIREAIQEALGDSP